MSIIEHLLQLSIHSYYAGETEVGLRSCEKALRMEISQDIETTIRANRTWYTPPLEKLIHCEYKPIPVSPALPHWSTFNPSILSTEDGWTVNVRSSNYKIQNGYYIYHPKEETIIKTINILAELDNNFSVRSYQALQADYPKTNYPVDGLEDVRLNKVGDDIITSASVRNYQPLDGTCRIAKSKLADGKFQDIFPIMVPVNEHQKNWMPLLGKPIWLYHPNYNGFVSTVSLNGIIKSHAPSPVLAKGFRGGSQLIPIGNGLWLTIIHEVAILNSLRVYEHRFVLFDEGNNFKISAVTPPFYLLQKQGIEFVAGLARKEDRLVATFGVRDEEAWIMETSLSKVISIMVSPV